MRRKHHGLQAWRHAVELVKNVYTLTSTFPAVENYGLIAQMRRCAISVPSNIAEGAARNSKREFLQFLGVARGSLSELETQFVIAYELGYVQDREPMQQSLDDTFALLGGLIRSVKGATRE